MNSYILGRGDGKAKENKATKDQNCLGQETAEQERQNKHEDCF